MTRKGISVTLGGVQGPQGPTGATGPTGPTGPAGASGGSGVFIYNSGGSQDEDNLRYNDWSDLITAVGELPPDNASIRFEQNETIPVGAWDLNGATFLGPAPTASSIFITCPDGCTFTNPNVDYFSHGPVDFVSTSSSPIITLTGSNAIFNLEKGGKIASQTAPFVRFTGSGGLNIVGLGDSAGVINGLSVPGLVSNYSAIEFTGSPLLAVVSAPGIGATIGEDTLRTTTANVYVQKGTKTAILNETQPNVAGSIIIDDLVVIDHGDLTNLDDDDHTQYSLEIDCATHINFPVPSLTAPYFGLGATFVGLTFFPEGAKVLLTAQEDRADNGVYVVPADWSTDPATRPVDYLDSPSTWAERGLKINTLNSVFATGFKSWGLITPDGVNWDFAALGWDVTFPCLHYTTNLDIGTFTSPIGTAPGIPVILEGQTVTAENGFYTMDTSGDLHLDGGMTVAIELMPNRKMWVIAENGSVLSTNVLKARDVSGTWRQIYPADVPSVIVGNYVASGGYTLVADDAGKCVEMGDSGAVNVEVPPNSSVPFPIGTVIEVYGAGSGTYTITEGSGVTVQNQGAIDGQFATVSLRKRDTDEWVLSGAIA